MDFYNYILKDSETRVKNAMKFQIKDRMKENFGAVDSGDPYTEAKPVAYNVGTAVAVYLCKDSHLYRSQDVFEFLIRAIQYIQTRQREDGTFDLEDCNFYSAPDTAFLVQPLILAYKLLGQGPEDDEKTLLKNMLLQVIERAVDGMIMGGFHTPNHRWAIASVLATCLEIVPHKNLMDFIEQYLKEGIDCNEDGEYAERSAATYNVVNNTAMFSLYESLGKEEYLEYACRNLQMMCTYIEPDGSIFTDNSTRQDKGKKFYPRDYFYQYLYAGNITKNQDFLRVASQIITEAYERKTELAPDCLAKLMVHPTFALEYTGQGGFPTQYNKYYQSSGLVRIRNGNYSCSIIKNSTKVLVFQAGKTMLYLKIGMNYFDQRNFVAHSIQKIGEQYVLEYQADGWYYAPFKEQPETSDWWAMDNSKREKSIKNRISLQATITPVENGIEFYIQSEGCDRVKATFEIGVPPTAQLETEAFFLKGAEGAHVLVKEGVVQVKNGEDRILIGPGFAKHHFLDGKFGGEERSSYAQTIYFTEETNFQRKITFLCE